MEKGEIIKQLTALFIKILDRNDLVLTEQTTAAEIKEWDSLTHLQLVVAIEKHFKLKFTSREIQSWKNIGELVDSIFSKQ